MDNSANTLCSLPTIKDPRGSLTFIEGGIHVPFEVKRLFYIYDVPTAQSRGAHAHKSLHQFLVCLSGSFDVSLDNGEGVEKIIHLNRPWTGLYIRPMTWAAELNFDQGAICLVLASDVYREEDYIRDYDLFRQSIISGNHVS